MTALRVLAGRSSLCIVGCLMACSSGSTTTTTRVPARPAPPAARPPAAPAYSTTATATMHDLAGARVGTVTFTDTYAGLLIRGTVAELGLGAHAIHIHS